VRYSELLVENCKKIYTQPVFSASAGVTLSEFLESG